MIFANFTPATLPYITTTLTQIVEAITNISGYWSGNYSDAIDSPISARCKKFVALVESKNNPASLGIEADGSIAYGLYQFGYRNISFIHGKINPALEVVLEYSRRSSALINPVSGTDQYFKRKIQPISGETRMIAAQQAVADALYFKPARDYLSEHGFSNAVDMLFAYNLWINYGARNAPNYMAKGTIKGCERLLQNNPYDGIQSQFFQWRYQTILNISKTDEGMWDSIGLDWKGWKESKTV